MKLYADDSKIPLQLTDGTDLRKVYYLYEKYTKVSGLKINYRKSSALCINQGWAFVLLFFRSPFISVPEV